MGSGQAADAPQAQLDQGTAEQDAAAAERDAAQAESETDKAQAPVVTFLELRDLRGEAWPGEGGGDSAWSDRTRACFSKPDLTSPR